MPTQRIDKLETSDPAIVFDGPSQTWRIAPGIVVASHSDYAVESLDVHDTLINRGNILSGITAMKFEADNALVNNAADGSIIGAGSGIFFQGHSDALNNHGKIIAQSGAGASFLNGGTVNNFGLLFGGGEGIVEGIVDAGTDHGLVIHNTGSIRGLDHGVGIDHDTGVATVIDNGGMLKGGEFAIYGINGRLSLTNHGTIVGAIDLNGDNDRDAIVNHGKIKGQISLGEDNDLYDGRGGSVWAVFGEEGNDHLIGGNLADQLNGGLGRDAMTGKLGADRFDFDNIADSTVGVLHDVITDFSRAQHDRIDLADIDANGGLPGNQAFVFRGAHAFTGAGEVRCVLNDNPGTAHDITTIYGNVDAGLAPDFQIVVKGLVHFAAGDFVL